MDDRQRCVLCQFDVSHEDLITEDEEITYCRLLDIPDYSYFYTFFERHFLKVCHRYCLDMMPPTNQLPLGNLAGAMRYEYNPSPRQIAIRHHNIRSHLSMTLWIHFARLKLNLPLELWENVAEYLLPEFASANLQRLCHPKPKSSSASLSDAIWCRYINFEGIRYIAAFANEPSGNDWELIFQPSGERIVDIYTEENHLGITKLLFSSSYSSPIVDEAEGIWWRRYRVDIKMPSISGSSDGIKIRNLKDIDRDITAWNVPRSNSVRFEHCSSAYVARLPSRMSSLICNGPSVVGYSMLWDRGLVQLHAHRRGEPEIMYQSSSNKSWLHMPINSGEVITEIWLRRSLIRRERAVGIKTNTGRVFIAGIYAPRCSNWSLVDRPSQIGGIFFDCSEGRTFWLAFESDKPAPPKSPFPIPKPSNASVSSTEEDFFYSDHDLTGLVGVTPCKFSDKPATQG